MGRSQMLDFYGSGKVNQVGCWMRAAKGMDPDTLVALKDYPKIKGSYVWDNSYLVVSSSKSRDKLSPAFAAEALKILSGHGAELTAATFIDKVCKPMRLIEVWRTLMCKRFGSVAAQSAALTRVVARLTSWGGLVAVRRCIDAGVIFQDATAGIPECSLLAAEFAKCKAGGLPPPARIPSEAELKAERDTQT